MDRQSIIQRPTQIGRSNIRNLRQQISLNSQTPEFSIPSQPISSNTDQQIQDKYFRILLRPYRLVYRF